MKKAGERAPTPALLSMTIIGALAGTVRRR
jgi:hypothetical protein